MDVISIKDLPREKALAALKYYRIRYFNEEPDEEAIDQVYRLLGGRLSFLDRAAKSIDMVEKSNEICQIEKTWLLNQCGLLGGECDDDVMAQQKFASAAMVLCKALVEMELEMEAENSLINQGQTRVLAEIPLYKARKIMSRADFIQQYDHINIFTIDSRANVRADSVPMANAMREVCTEPGFDRFLNDTLKRISDIESLGRTRELVLKDLWDSGKYQVQVCNAKGDKEKSISFGVQLDTRSNDQDDG